VPKDQIRISKRLVVFITRNSKGSKWVPWELGIGDAILNTSKIALLPASQDGNDQYWAKQEYLGLYDRIVYGHLKGYSEKVWMVYNFRENSAVEISRWF
jgi:hypothetical protein